MRCGRDELEQTVLNSVNVTLSLSIPDFVIASLLCSALGVTIVESHNLSFDYVY